MTVESAGCFLKTVGAALSLEDSLSFTKFFANALFLKDCSWFRLFFEWQCARLGGRGRDRTQFSAAEFMNDQTQSGMRKYPVTRMTLVDALAESCSAERWSEFFDLYSPLIRGAARRAGLSDTEVDDVLQETLIQVSEYMGDEMKRYRPGKGPFHGWLYNIARWKIGDRFKRRKREARDGSGGADDVIESLASHGPSDLDAVWNRAWMEFIRAQALVLVQQQASPRQFQIFQMNVLNNRRAQEVAVELGVSTVQVYLAKHRVGAMLRKQVRRLEKMSP
ncbi:MAG: sigma-70 family RNA polymerase sigma factor [Verrucomicrobiales bacterium]|nr:sigma-70 family RNA polymerase sigma factor [Verrucomicrobiales bacterium]